MALAAAERVARRYIQAAGPGVLPSSLKSRINKKMAERRYGLDGNTYYKKPGLGLARAADLLQSIGIELAETITPFELTRNDPKATMATIRIAFTNQQDAFSPEEITNSMLVLTSYQIEPGKWEVVAYLS